MVRSGMMRALRFTLVSVGGVLAVLYAIFLTWLYFNQESMIFHPDRLPASYQFAFDAPHREISITAADGEKLSGLLFTVPHPKGLVFYLHGNAGALDRWGDIAPHYTGRGFDCFILDYRGFGKSEGSIESEAQFLGDVDAAYEQVTKPYGKIVVIGYSIGTGPAAYLASVHHPAMLILQAPYYSLDDLADTQVPLVPGFVKKYHFRTDRCLKAVTCPVIIFHGDADKLIPHQNSVALSRLFKPHDTLITLDGQPHVGMNDNPHYLSDLGHILDTISRQK